MILVTCFMKLFDIEADYYTAMSHKEVEKLTLVDVFALLYQGSKLFDARLPPGSAGSIPRKTRKRLPSPASGSP
jgi:hypothetical protein